MNASFTLRSVPPAGLDRASIVVWLVEFAAWRDRLSSLRDYLDPSQRERAARLRDPAHRRDRELIYALHRVALGRFLGLPAGCVPLQRTPDGQPWLPDGDVHTSLSHASEHAAIAISAAGPVGVDIEPSARSFALAELAERICHPDELSRSSEVELLRLWVRKEAALKAIGKGLSIEMSTFSAPDDGLLFLRPEPTFAEVMLRVRHVDAGEECVAAVAGPPNAIIEVCWLLPDDKAMHSRADERADENVSALQHTQT